jgi:hypothetical protein
MSADGWRGDCDDRDLRRLHPVGRDVRRFRTCVKASVREQLRPGGGVVTPERIFNRSIRAAYGLADRSRDRRL